MPRQQLEIKTGLGWEEGAREGDLKDRWWWWWEGEPSERDYLKRSSALQVWEGKRSTGGSEENSAEHPAKSCTSVEPGAREVKENGN